MNRLRMLLDSLHRRVSGADGRHLHVDELEAKSRESTAHTDRALREHANAMRSLDAVGELVRRRDET